MQLLSLKGFANPQRVSRMVFGFIKFGSCLLVVYPFIFLLVAEKLIFKHNSVKPIHKSVSLWDVTQLYKLAIPLYSSAQCTPIYTQKAMLGVLKHLWNWNFSLGRVNCNAQVDDN